MTLKAQIRDLILDLPGRRLTNADIAVLLGANQPSVRRATLQLMSEGVIDDGGPASYNSSVVTYVAPEAGL